MKLIRYDDNRFVFQCTFTEKEIAKSNGFKWDMELRHWYTTDVLIAAKLSTYAEDQSIFTKIMEERKVEIQKSNASQLSVDMDIPIKEGMSYLPYQKAGIAYMLNKTNVLLADEPGLGKTLQSIGIINYHTWIKKVLVICPASLKLNWRNEFNKFMARPELTIGLIDKEIPDTNIVITNYDVVHKWKEQLDLIQWDLLISDECHKLKSHTSRRTKMILGGMGTDNETGKKQKIHPIPSKRNIFMTGTPILNRPIDLWTLVHRLDPTGLGGNWKTFVERYCDGGQGMFGWDVNGSSNLDELQERLRASCMCRRLKSEVLKELPPKRRSIITIQSDKKLSKLIDNEEYETKLNALKSNKIQDIAEIAKIRHEIALAKVPLCMEHIIDAAEQEQIIVFAHHRDVIDLIMNGLKEAGISCGSIVGGDSIERRQQVVDGFQAHKLQVVVLSIQAAGVGLTLTASSHEIFMELDWSPSIVSQAEDRAHRIGQKDSLFIEHIVVDRSIEVHIAQTIIRKQEIADQALDNETNGVTTDLKSIQESMVTPIDSLTTESIINENNPLGLQAPGEKSARVKAIEKLANELTSDQMVEIHRKLQSLAGMDTDYGKQKNEIGFNHFDTEMGHNLSALTTLTTKQAALGYFIVKKYHKQVGELSFSLKEDIKEEKIKNFVDVPF